MAALHRPTAHHSRIVHLARARRLGAVELVRVLDSFVPGSGVMDVRLFGRARIVHSEDENTARSSAGRAALDAAAYAPPILVSHPGLRCAARSDELIVCRWDVPPERPEVHIRIDHQGAVRSISALRWGKMGSKDYQYIPCGGDVFARAPFRRLPAAEQPQRRLVVGHAALQAVLPGRARRRRAGTSDRGASVSGTALRRLGNAVVGPRSCALRGCLGSAARAHRFPAATESSPTSCSSRPASTPIAPTSWAAACWTAVVR